MSPVPVEVFIGLGSNLDNPVSQLKRALVALAGLSDAAALTHSRLYRSPPMGPADQPPYVNAVARLRTKLCAEALLMALLSVERDHGRIRGEDRWGPRTLDLDLLLYGDAVIQQPGLKVPHPGLTDRAFVLYPLAELAPDLVIPVAGPLRDHLARVPDEGLTLVEE